jgi:hypothetical protein
MYPRRVQNDLHSACGHVYPEKDKQHVHCVLELLAHRSSSEPLEVMHPEKSWEDQAERRQTKSSGQTEQIVQNRDVSHQSNH